MANVSVLYSAPGGFDFMDSLEKEPALGESVMIGADQFVVRAVFVFDYWDAYGDVNCQRNALVVLAYKSAEAA